MSTTPSLSTYRLAERIYDNLRFTSRSYRRKLALADPEAAVRLCYQHTCKKKLNLDHPTTLPEVIQWLKLRSDTSRWPELADKYAVRDYVKECGLETHLNELYGCWEQPQNIDWDSLPDSFVLKLNNGCHSVLPIRNKKCTNKEDALKQFQKWMKHPFGLESAEFHYLPIPPKIIAEKYLQQEPSLMDYKIYCIGGKAQAILHCQERVQGKAVKTLLDTNWNVIPEYNTRTLTTDDTPGKPVALDEMILAAQKLAQPFPFVRVDYYEIDGRPIFGEMTFTPAGGYKPYGTPTFYQEMGLKIMNLFTNE